jgi:hypothetical protein
MRRQISEPVLVAPSDKLAIAVEVLVGTAPYFRELRGSPSGARVPLDAGDRRYPCAMTMSHGTRSASSSRSPLGGSSGARTPGRL